MKNSVKLELLHHLKDALMDNYSADAEDFSELHHMAFNQDYYLMGYYQCEQWLKTHDLSPFEVIEEVTQYEKDVYGESVNEINAEAIVNMYSYIKGGEVIDGLDADVYALETTRQCIYDAITDEINQL